MTKYQISTLLDELKSDEAYTRNDAIKKIIKGKINDEKIIVALMDIIEHDQSTAVRNFAHSALNALLYSAPNDYSNPDLAKAAQQVLVLHTFTESPVDTNSGQLSTDNSSKNNAQSALTGIAMGIVAFIISVPSFFILAILFLRVLPGPTGDAAASMIFFVWPFILSGLVAIIVGIRSGGNNDKDLLKDKIQEAVNGNGYVDPTEKERQRVEKLGIEVIVCPNCGALNSLSLLSCEKCRANLKK